MADYQIQPGDTLSKIAKMYGTTVKQLQQMNGIKNANLIFAGKTLKVPDLTSDEAFQLPGLTVEQQNQKGGKKSDKIPDVTPEIRTVYSIQVPKDGEDKPKIPRMPWNPENPKDPNKPGVKLVYAYIPPKDGKEPGKIVPMYGITCPPGGDEPVKPQKPVKPKDPQNPNEPIIIRVPEKPGRGRRIIIELPADPLGNVVDPQKTVKKPPKKKTGKSGDNVGDKPPVDKPTKKKTTKPKPPTDFSD